MDKKRGQEDNSMRFQGKVAIITGSGRGIGKVIAQKFSREGANVTVCDISEETARATCAEIISHS